MTYRFKYRAQQLNRRNGINLIREEDSESDAPEANEASFDWFSCLIFGFLVCTKLSVVYVFVFFYWKRAYK